MVCYTQQHARGKVRDAIFHALSESREPISTKEIQRKVTHLIGDTPESSIRSYLQLNTPEIFVREGRGSYCLKTAPLARPKVTELPEPVIFGKSKLYHGNCLDLIEQLPDHSIHAVVTDPPYGLHEYTDEQQEKLRQGKGGVWRIPPSFDGHERSPLPRFTTLTLEQLKELGVFFLNFARILLPKLVPGANVVVASNPLLSYIVSQSFVDAGLERRGELIRLVMTMRGGDRPKDAHEEFDEVSVMPRSMWEPWLIYRKTPEGRIQDNLRKWQTGGFRRPSSEKPFGDVLGSAPTRATERALAPHPSLKPQAFLRSLVRGVLPLGKGIILDPFAGAGSTLAAAQAVGYASIGFERDYQYFQIAKEAVPKLSILKFSNAIDPFSA
jgi:site-specific DNA-methyltransferase (adenine-specific)